MISLTTALRRWRKALASAALVAAVLALALGAHGLRRWSARHGGGVPTHVPAENVLLALAPQLHEIGEALRNLSIAAPSKRSVFARVLFTNALGPRPEPSPSIRSLVPIELRDWPVAADSMAMGVGSLPLIERLSSNVGRFDSAALVVKRAGFVGPDNTRYEVRASFVGIASRDEATIHVARARLRMRFEPVEPRGRTKRAAHWRVYDFRVGGLETIETEARLAPVLGGRPSSLADLARLPYPLHDTLLDHLVAEQRLSTSGPVLDRVVSAPKPALEIGICQPAESLERDLEIVARDRTEGWAVTRCAATPPAWNRTADDYCTDWRRCTRELADGTTYLAFVVKDEHVGGHLRFRGGSDHRAVLVAHSGGGGTSWLDDRGGSWRDLEQHGIRVVAVKWLDTGINYYISGGRFTRNSAAGTTFEAMARRPAALFEWVFDHLNPDELPFAILGPSAGADAALSPIFTRSRIADRIRFLGILSYAPFYDFAASCSERTPPGSYVNQAAGALGGSGVRATLRLGATTGVRRFPDSVWQSDACRSGAVPSAVDAASSGGALLDRLADAGAPRYAGALYVGVANEDDSDDDIGTTWAAGNLMHHRFFTEARPRIWYQCRTHRHGHQFERGSRCVLHLHAAIRAALLGESDPARTAVRPGRLSVTRPRRR
jgi:hypothetical protein